MNLNDFPESFLHFIWQYKHFDLTGLKTIEGDPVTILDSGILNHDQGPDFLHARIQIGKLRFHGHVEIHLDSQDWYTHRHQVDPTYNPTILHVVGQSRGKAIFRADGHGIPELSLEDRIDPDLIHSYHSMQLAQEQLPCSFGIQSVKSVTRNHWIERMAVERIMLKAQKMTQRLKLKREDWNQILWEEIAAMVGGKVNQEAFRELAIHIPYSILTKELQHLHRLEALLFGAGGFLTGKGKGDTYFQQLQTEWKYLREKYRLSSQLIPFKFLRMRPAGFPTIRISQLAALVHQLHPIIQLLEVDGIQKLLKTQIKSSIYWENHYRFFEEKKTLQSKQLGKSQKEVLLINTIIPFGYLYRKAHGRSDLNEMLEEQLSQIRPENNKLTRVFTELGLKNPNALFSQGYIQLKKFYCNEKRCLECAIGHAVLKKKPKPLPPPDSTPARAPSDQREQGPPVPDLV